MKKTAALLLILALLLSCLAVFTACGSSDKDDGKTKDTKDKTTTKASAKDEDEDDEDNDGKETNNSSLNGGNGNGSGGGNGGNQDGGSSVPAWSGEVDTSWYDENKDDFVLTTAEQLAGFAKIVNEMDGDATINITLGADINLNSREWTPIAYNRDNEVEGTFDGAGYTISNLTIAQCNRQYVGFFGYCHFEVKNLGLENVAINVTPGSLGASIGGVAGCLDAHGFYDGITACYTTGSISATASGNVYAGGVVGDIVVGDVEKCYSSATVKATVNVSEYVSFAETNVGGLIGCIMDNGAVKSVRSCYATGDVTATVTGGDVYVGGLVGCTGDDSVSRSYATGAVKAENSSSEGAAEVGGVVGKAGSNDKVWDCYRCEGQTTDTTATVNSLGTQVQESEIKTVAFYTETLYWQDTDWTFTDGAHPTLKYTPDEA